mmetsp:Transcript_40731/g.53648  ORF Transcript_40731/g.53648 Transcript_40731/m.53648 type:complete len:346 (+) Transcript_40731:141-1178(+)|eukprot:CAMPEP_0117760398 /NCGR_PEP_ID=MMETSP0947-20121206/16603_1 /TAXON_ID=44440 /ORGANISM="Chattonella subsalsa, Strain CCMP2191" /LENGTH=345 /DNA_ID=CAMNT_0005581075 /DNA_START=136 /DNA_END=1173 /DNA_ORIENTATION=-
MSRPHEEEDFSSDEEVIEEIDSRDHVCRQTNTETLKQWLLTPSNFIHPYPKSKVVQAHLCKISGLNPKQLKNWFTNARRRIWKPVLKKILCTIDLEPFLEEARVASNPNKKKYSPPHNVTQSSEPQAQVQLQSDLKSVQCEKSHHDGTKGTNQQDLTPAQVQIITPPLLPRELSSSALTMELPNKRPFASSSAISLLKSKRQRFSSLFPVESKPVQKDIAVVAPDATYEDPKPAVTPDPVLVQNEPINCFESHIPRLSVQQEVGAQSERNDLSDEAIIKFEQIFECEEQEPVNCNAVPQQGQSFGGVSSAPGDLCQYVSEMEHNILNQPLCASPFQDMHFNWSLD